MRLFLVAAVVLIVVISASASAYETANITQMVRVDPVGEYTDIYNMSDPANQSLMNYNQTIQPFLNESGIDGAFTGGYMPPVLIKVSDDVSITSWKFLGVTRFLSRWVMSGSSYSWWRAPLMNMTDAEVRLQIYHVDNPEYLNISDAGVINEVAHPVMVYDNIYYTSSNYNITWRRHNITAWDLDWTFSWYRVVAPIHSDEFYLYSWTISDATQPGGVQAILSRNDIGDDRSNVSWVIADGGIDEIPAEWDCSVIHEYGMGDAVSGFEVTPDDNTTLVFYSEISEPVDSAFDTITFLMPFMKDITNGSNVRVSLQNENASFSSSYWVAEDGPTDFTIHSFQWGKSYSCSKFRVFITFQNNSNSIFLWDENSEFDLYYDDTGSHRTGRFELVDQDPEGFYHYFQPYHALQGGDGYWVNTNIDPVYYLDGKVVNLEDLRLKTESHHFPLLAYIGLGIILIPYVIYNIVDKILFFDLLPNLDYTQYMSFVMGITGMAIAGILTTYTVLHSIGVKFVEFVQWVVKWAPYVISLIAKGITLIFFVPFFIFAVLIVNGVKRFFYTLAKDGPEDAAEFAEDFIKNSIKFARKIPVVAVASNIKDRMGGE